MTISTQVSIAATVFFISDNLHNITKYGSTLYIGMDKVLAHVMLGLYAVSFLCILCGFMMSLGPLCLYI